MPRFVLLYHECPPSFGKPSHWDLMLEQNGFLMTWSLADLPANWRTPPGHSLTEPDAIRLPNHRLEYLDFEGPVSGDRGHVSRVDRGEYVVVEETAEWLDVRLVGATAIGEVRLSIAPSP
jgi:hypothetical protein